MLADYFAARPAAWTPRRALAEFVQRIHRQLVEESRARFESTELVTTLAAGAIAGRRFYGVTLGDSPAFLFRDGRSRPLSSLHNSPHPGEDHVLTDALGLHEEAHPYFFELDLQPGDRLLLCTDGVAHALGEPALEGLLVRHAAARAFVTDAHAASSDPPDDATAVVVEIEEGIASAANGQRLQVIAKLEAGDLFPDGRLIRPFDDARRVWLAMGPGSQVVLKFPPLAADGDELRAEAFLREAWQASRVDNPEFVRARVPSTPVLMYYVQDYIDAPTLRSRLRDGPLPVEGAIALGRFLARAAQHLARRDLAHGDLKPENILVLRPGGGWDFRLIDLGSAAGLFSVTSRAGTASYLAPERFQRSPLSERTEIFSIGVILFEALTGRLPFGHIERFQTPRFTQSPRAPSTHNPAVPTWLDALVLRALCPRPEQRHAHFSELAHEFVHPAAVRPFHRPDAPLIERHPVGFYRALCLALLALNVLQLWLRQRHAP
jgi:serine/threonine protein kinase